MTADFGVLAVGNLIWSRLKDWNVLIGSVGDVGLNGGEEDSGERCEGLSS